MDRGKLGDVINIGRRLAGEEREKFTRHWKARAASDPQWAADQIDGLLARALDAESKLEALQDGT